MSVSFRFVGDTNPNDTSGPSSWPSKRLMTLESVDALMERLDYIRSYIAKELWLPDEVISAFVKTHASLKRSHESRELDYPAARAEIQRLAAQCFAYDSLTLRSKTLCQVRTLDLELSALESDQNGARAVSATTGTSGTREAAVSVTGISA